MKASMPHAGSPVSSMRAMVRERMLVEDVDDGEVPLTVEEEALLLRQCRLNKVELVEKTIDSGKIGPNFEFSNGDTVLIIACKCGYKKLALAVMQRGANMDLRDPEGNTAAHWAFAMGFNDLADFILAKGANDRIANNQGFTCRNWRRPEPGDGSTDTLSAHGPNLQPNSVSPSRLAGAEKEMGVHLPVLSPQREINQGQVAYKQNPRPLPGRARKKVRRKDVEPTVYQRMYLALDEPERSQSTPPLGRHEPDEVAHRPCSSRGRLDSANPGVADQSVTSSPTGPGKVTIVTVSPSKKQSRGPVLKNPVVPAADNEPDEKSGLVSILKFVRDGGGTVNEPFSVEAMRKLGIVSDELLPTDKAKLKKKFKDDKVVEVRYKLMEERRLDLLKRCTEERRRLRARSRDASLEEIFIEYAGDMQMNIGEFMEMLSRLDLLSDGADKPGKLGKTHAANIFKAFAIRIGPTFEITWEQFTKMEKQISADLGIKSIRCPEEKVKKPAPIVTPGRFAEQPIDKHAISTDDRLELIRKKDEKNTEIEMRRIEKQFGRVLEVRAAEQAYREQTRRMEAEKLAKLEAKSFELASHRIETEFEHVERLMIQEQEYQKRIQEEEARILKKQQEAAAALERKERERRERNQLVSETLKVKQELRETQRKQSERREEYNRKILQDKILRDKERIDSEKNEKEAMLRERRHLWAQKNQERTLFERATVEFKKTGVLRKPPGITSMGSFDELIEKKVVLDERDQNTQAILLHKDSAMKSVVEHGEYVHFKICVKEATQVHFTIKSLQGRAEMYIGNHQNPFPSKENNTWSKVGHDKLTVFHLDRNFNLGYYYIGVYGQGQGQSLFSLMPSWSVTREDDQNIATQSLDDERNEEAAVIQRVKERINKVLQSRLAGKDAAFVRKYEELFMEKQSSSVIKKE